MGEGSIWNLDVKTVDSVIWKSITKVANLFRDRFHFKFGRGDISFWYDNRLPKGKLCNLVPFVHISYLELCVRDVYADGQWQFNMLSTSLPPDLIDSISFIPTAVGCVLDDVVVWSHIILTYT